MVCFPVIRMYPYTCLSLLICRTIPISCEQLTLAMVTPERSNIFTWSEQLFMSPNTPAFEAPLGITNQREKRGCLIFFSHSNIRITAITRQEIRPCCYIGMAIQQLQNSLGYRRNLMHGEVHGNIHGRSADHQYKTAYSKPITVNN